MSMEILTPAKLISIFIADPPRDSTRLIESADTENEICKSKRPAFASLLPEIFHFAFWVIREPTSGAMHYPESIDRPIPYFSPLSLLLF
jgi:hypothetical protein